MTFALSSYNRFVQFAILAAVMYYSAAAGWNVVQSTGSSLDPLQIESFSLNPQPSVEYPAIARNVFDPIGQAWQTSEKVSRSRSVASVAKDAGEVKGVINIPGFKGVLTDSSFVPVGGEISGGNLQEIQAGKAKISTNSGMQEIDLDAGRAQQRQSLGIKIE